jgi:hypothetical protein
VREGKKEDKKDGRIRKEESGRREKGKNEGWPGKKGGWER